MRANTEADRVTISLPHTLAHQAEVLRTELQLSRSELYRIAMEHFIDERRRGWQVLPRKWPKSIARTVNSPL